MCSVHDRISGGVGPTLFCTMLIVCKPRTNMILSTVLGYSERPECAHWAVTSFPVLRAPTLDWKGVSNKFQHISSHSETIFGFSKKRQKACEGVNGDAINTYLSHRHTPARGWDFNLLFPVWALRAVTGRWCPDTVQCPVSTQWGGGRLFGASDGSPHENGHNSERN